MKPEVSSGILLVAVLHTLLGLPLSASVQQSRGRRPKTPLPTAATFHVARATGEIDIDGVMDETAWEDAVRIPLEYESFPGDNVAPPVETACRITYDPSNLYFGCRAYDPDPPAIRAHLADRDDLTRTVQDDHIVILLDPFNDERRGFQFRVNALGVQMDAIFSSAAGSEDFSWDAIWASAGRITETGYVVEVAIPFRSLRFPRTQGPQTWGFFFERSYPRSNRHRMRSIPTDRNNTCLLCQANKLMGLEGITPGNNLEFHPTTTSSRTDRRADFPDGPMVAGDIEVEPGLDIRWGITPNLSLNTTVNPDFSQVEADVAQLEVNTRFARFFPEKRPFFLEGADFFVTPIKAVFTRTVADPTAGVKLSGKVGPNALGVFLAHDQVTNLLFPANQGSRSTRLEQSATTGVVRYRRDLGQASYLGFLYTGREGSSYHNRVAGLDGFVQVSPANTLRFQYLGSETSYPDSVAQVFGESTDGVTGGGLRVQFRHSSRHWAGKVEYEDLSPDFRADAGFVRQVDVRAIEGEFKRIFWGSPGGWFTQWQISVSAERTMDHRGTLTEQGLWLGASYLGPGQTSADVVLVRGSERVGDIGHALQGIAFGVETRPAGSLQLRVDGWAGGAVDFANNRKAFSVELEPSAQVSIGRPITLNLSHIFERLSFEGGRIFTANLFQAQMSYHFDVRTFVRVIVQYEDVSRNPDAYTFPVESHDRNLFTQFLFSYKLNPQTVAFVGYSNNRVGTANISLRQTSRTFFVKLGYAWRP